VAVEAAEEITGITTGILKRGIRIPRIKRITIFT
jgi:hypothetical protein